MLVQREPADEPSFAEMRQLVDDNQPLGNWRVKLGLDIVLYYEGGFRENADGILHFYNQAIEVIGDKVEYFLTDGEGTFKKVKKDTLQMLPFWTTAEAAPRAIYGLDLEGGPTGKDVSDTAFQMYNTPGRPGWVRLVVPLEFVSSGVDAFVSLAKTAAEKLPFLSGSAGYAVNVKRGYPSSMEVGRIALISKRFRGIDIGRPLFFSSYLSQSIKCVNWLTFIGDWAVDELGGIDKINARLGKDIVVHELPHGLMIQAGPSPGFGDVNRREELPYYRKVGQVLRPLRIPLDVLGPYDEIAGSENTRNWLARFDK
jgi:TseV toxin immunity protein TsiV